MGVTIKEIAVRAGVSRGTVDRVLHNRPGVRPEVAKHVRQIADALGFFPNRAGKMLAARKQPLTIGCFFPAIGNAFFDGVRDGFLAGEKEFADYGVSVLLESVRGYDPADHIPAIDRLVGKNCGALCVCTMDTPEMRARINQIVDSGIPVVAVNTDLTHTGRLCYVGCDYFNTGQTAAGLVSLMARENLKLLIVTGSLYVKGHNDRMRGFCRTLRENGVPCQLMEVFESQDSDRHAYQSTMKVLERYPEINCVYNTAAGVGGVCKAIVEMGLQDRICVVTHDQTAETVKYVKEGVIDFTVCQEPWNQGYRAIQLLFDYFVSDKVNVPKNHITSTGIKIKQNLG